MRLALFAIAAASLWAAPVFEQTDIFTVGEGGYAHYPIGGFSEGTVE